MPLTQMLWINCVIRYRRIRNIRTDVDGRTIMWKSQDGGEKGGTFSAYRKCFSLPLENIFSELSALHESFLILGWRGIPYDFGLSGWLAHLASISCELFWPPGTGYRYSNAG